MRVIQEHQTATKQEILDGILGCRSIKDIDVHIISQLKGQVYAMEAILDIHNFITEEDIKSLDNEEDESVESIGP